jgi:hypothetical protein
MHSRSLYGSRWHHRHALRAAYAWAACDPGLGAPDSGAPDWAEEALARARHWAHRHGGSEGPFAGSGLGVRRPLRFLAWRLELSEPQTAALGRILERLKLDRAQAALDLRRAAADLADAVEAAEFPKPLAAGAADQRAAAARRVEEALARALEELHGLLEPAQRSRLADLIRSGQIRI